jgi:hypothetical protein
MLKTIVAVITPKVTVSTAKPSRIRADSVRNCYTVAWRNGLGEGVYSIL